MTRSSRPEGTPDIPAQVFEEFVQALRGSDLSAESVALLRKALLEDRTFTEHALEKAILAEEPEP